jgi:lipopolysaccharide/colanic/teichoic acid biosynthesis glycosyltransferase
MNECEDGRFFRRPTSSCNSTAGRGSKTNSVHLTQSISVGKVSNTQGAVLMSSFTSLVDQKYAVAASHVPEFQAIHSMQTSRSTRLSRPDTWSLSRHKRILDICISIAALSVLGVPMLIIAVCIRLSSRGPAIFVQRRVGQGGRLFSIFKFRSMELSSHRRGAGLTTASDSRVTHIGRWLRKRKLDELPQFYNVLRGDMSLVGPRPKLPEYAEELTLAYRPGITGAASLAFRDEEDILACLNPNDVESYYLRRIKPLKASIDERYMRHSSFGSDMRIVASTLFASMVLREHRALQHHDVEETFAPATAIARFQRNTAIPPLRDQAGCNY